MYLSIPSKFKAFRQNMPKLCECCNLVSASNLGIKNTKLSGLCTDPNPLCFKWSEAGVFYLGKVKIDFLLLTKGVSATRYLILGQQIFLDYPKLSHFEIFRMKETTVHARTSIAISRKWLFLKL